MNAPIFHRVLDQFRGLQLDSNRSFHLGVSGGADSVALLYLMKEVCGVLKAKLRVLHCYHGAHQRDQDVSNYRAEAVEAVRQHCRKLSVEFHTNYSSSIINRGEESEAALRQIRYNFFQSVFEEFQEEAPILCLAHHQDDVLETQILQLVRGCGPTAFLEQAAQSRENGNGIYKGSILRPLVREPKAALCDFVELNKIEVVQDPSNESTDPLRNWLRNSWLPALEAKRPGSIKSFSRSLGLLSEWVSDTCQHLPLELLENGEINRDGFGTLSKNIKARLVVHYLQQSEIFGLSESQVAEVLKQLDTSKNDHMFSLAGCQWSLSKHRIKVSAPVVP